MLFGYVTIDNFVCLLGGLASIGLGIALLTRPDVFESAMKGVQGRTRADVLAPRRWATITGGAAFIVLGVLGVLLGILATPTT